LTTNSADVFIASSRRRHAWLHRTSASLAWLGGDHLGCQLYLYRATGSFTAVDPSGAGCVRQTTMNDVVCHRRSGILKRRKKRH